MDRLSELLPIGPPLSEAQQIGRHGAIDSLTDRLRSRHVVKMLEPRRVGKTSVARAALERIRLAGGAVAAVDLAKRTSSSDVAKDLADQLGAPISTSALGLLLDQSHGHPYCTMLLAHESGRLGIDVGEVSETAVQAALVTVRRDEAWQDLR